jgi:hypothetical protein
VNGQYEVLNPWAEVDPIVPRGISPRVTDLNGKTIGLFCLAKRAARPIQTVMERKLKERFPTCKFSWWIPEAGDRHHQVQAKDLPRLEKWARGVDTVIAAVGD